MNPFSRVAVAALAVIAIVGGGIYFFSPTGQVAGPSPAPTAPPPPTAAPSVLPPSSETIDRSAADGYRVTVPASWNYSVVPNGLFFSAAPPITAATLYVGQSVAGETPATYVIHESGGSVGTITVVTVTGRTIDELLASVNEAYFANFSTQATGERQATIDGEPAWVTEHATSQPANLWIDAVVIHGDHAYNLSVNAAPDNAQVLRTTFDEIVSSIRWAD